VWSALVDLLYFDGPLRLNSLESLRDVRGQLAQAHICNVNKERGEFQSCKSRNFVLVFKASFAYFLFTFVFFYAKLVPTFYYDADPDTSFSYTK
jgi:hypothetical protein